jgi:hypothetical protein
LFRDAKLADLIEQSPCVLDERHLGPLIDKDPEWRSTAVFTHEEAETIISDRDFGQSSSARSDQPNHIVQAIGVVDVNDCQID